MLDFLAEEGVDDAGAAVEAHDELRDVALLHGVEHSGDEVEVEALDGREACLDGCGGTLGHVERVAPDGLGGGGVVVADMEGIEVARDGCVGEAHGEGEVYDAGGRERVGDGNEGAGMGGGVVAGALLVGLLEQLDLEARGGALGTEGGYGAGDEYHNDGAVEHCDVEEVHLIAYHHHGEGHGGVGVGELIHHRAVNGGEAVDFLRDEGGYPFGGHGHGAHDGGGVERGPSVEHNPEVDEHADADKEVRDEDGVADKFEAPHQGGARGDEAIEHKSGEEGAKHSLDADEGCEGGGAEHHHHNVDELADAVAVVLEEVAGDARVEVYEPDAVEGEVAEDGDEGGDGAVAIHAEHSGEDNEGAEDGDDGAGNGYDDGRSFGDAEAGDYRVGYEGVGGKHGSEQGGFEHLHAKCGHGCHGAEYEGYDEGEEAECEAFAHVFTQMVHVNLNAGEKHEVEYADLPEDFEAHVAGEDVETVGPDGYSRDNQANDVGNPETVEHNGGQQDYGHDGQENRDRLGYERRMGGYGE